MFIVSLPITIALQIVNMPDDDNDDDHQVEKPFVASNTE